MERGALIFGSTPVATWNIIDYRNFLDQNDFMKPIRLMVVFMLLAIAAVCSLWVMGFIGQDTAGDILKRSIALVGIVGSVLILIFYILKGSNSPGDDSKQKDPGPKF